MTPKERKIELAKEQDFLNDIYRTINLMCNPSRNRGDESQHKKQYMINLRDELFVIFDKHRDRFEREMNQIDTMIKRGEKEYEYGDGYCEAAFDKAPEIAKALGKIDISAIYKNKTASLSMSKLEDGDLIARLDTDRAFRAKRDEPAMALP